MAARLEGLLIGHGRMGRHHARKLAAQPGLRLHVHDPAQGLHAPAGLRPDFAVVATPTASHAAVAGPLLARGVPCLVEKPLAGTVAEAAALAALPGLAVGHSERFHPAVRALRAAVTAAGQRPRFFQGRRLAPPPDGALPDVDVVWDLMVHDLDLALAWLGPGWSEVRGTGVGVLGGAVDIAEARVELDHGVATFVASRVSPGRVRSLQLIAPGVYWSADLAQDRLHQRRWGQGAPPGPPRPMPLPAGDALDHEHAAFLAMVRTGRPFLVDGAAGLAAVRLAAEVRAACVRNGPSAPGLPPQAAAAPGPPSGPLGDPTTD